MGVLFVCHGTSDAKQFLYHAFKWRPSHSLKISNYALKTVLTPTMCMRLVPNVFVIQDMVLSIVET